MDSIKTHIRRLLLPVLIPLLAVLASCKEGPVYGHLEGMWQVMEVTDEAGRPVSIEKRRYYGFMHNVVQLRTQDGVYFHMTGNLRYEKPILQLDFPYYNELKNPSGIIEWGLTGEYNAMTVRELTHDRLVMTNPEGYTIRCRRF